MVHRYCLPDAPESDDSADLAIEVGEQKSRELVPPVPASHRCEQAQALVAKRPQDDKF